MIPAFWKLRINLDYSIILCNNLYCCEFLSSLQIYSPLLATGGFSYWVFFIVQCMWLKDMIKKITVRIQT